MVNKQTSCTLSTVHLSAGCGDLRRSTFAEQKFWRVLSHPSLEDPETNSIFARIELSGIRKLLRACPEARKYIIKLLQEINSNLRDANGEKKWRDTNCFNEA